MNSGNIQEFIRNRIYELRTKDKNKILSARVLSTKIGQNENYINQIENGKSMPSYDVLVSICEYYNITVSDFFNTEMEYPTKIKTLLDQSKILNEAQLDSIIDVATLYNKCNREVRMHDHRKKYI